jgi:hypothetical protein
MSDDTARSATGAGAKDRKQQAWCEPTPVRERRWSTVDTNLQEVFDTGRRTGHAEAVIAVYGVLEQYKGDEHHETWMALMGAVKAIQECRTES